ncbi:unnamed protein product [Periconia digitata]|uniref:Uncharacterized protein n=1 Tax=Periconia digitata TaxID=1303443 RepID=A0A9W4UIF3_9PLEO|nr:unnamed protein product [Periconia digitata]
MSPMGWVCLDLKNDITALLFFSSSFSPGILARLIQNACIYNFSIPLSYEPKKQSRAGPYSDRCGYIDSCLPNFHLPHFPNEHNNTEKKAFVMFKAHARLNNIVDSFNSSTLVPFPTLSSLHYSSLPPPIQGRSPHLHPISFLFHHPNHPSLLSSLALPRPQVSTQRHCEGSDCQENNEDACDAGADFHARAWAVAAR